MLDIYTLLKYKYFIDFYFYILNRKLIILLMYITPDPFITFATTKRSEWFILKITNLNLNFEKNTKQCVTDVHWGSKELFMDL